MTHIPSFCLWLLGEFVKFANSDMMKLRHVCPRRQTRLRLDGFFMKFENCGKICPENSSFIKIGQYKRIHLMETNTHFWKYLPRLFLERKTLQTKVVQKIKTRILCSTTFSENRAVYETMWKNVVQLDRPRMTIRRTRFACWITKASNTHSEYITIIALTRQQWSRERASILRYTYIACLVSFLW